MKILLIHQYFLGKNQGGGSRFNEMTKTWADEGHEITVLSSWPNFTGKKSENQADNYVFHEKDFYKGVDVFRCQVSDGKSASFIGRIWAYFTFVFSSIYAGLFKVKGKYDVLVVTSPPLFVGISAYVISIFKRLPLVFEVRDLWPESAIDTGVLTNKWLIKFSYWFEKAIYKKATLINVLTPAFRDKLINDKNIPPEKIIYIPNAADFSLAEQVAKNFDAKKFRIAEGIDDKFVVTYIGAHGIANHLIQLIDTAELLQDTNVLIQFVGGGMTKDDLVAEVAKRNLKNVRFVGFVDKPVAFEYILASDMGTSVLKNVDTFKTIYSNKTFDYMSCKKPILLAIDGVSRKLVEEANCGIFAEPENAEDIAKQIRRYLNGEFDIKQQGENGYKHAKEYFDREKLAHQYLDQMKKIARK